MDTKIYKLCEFCNEKIKKEAIKCRYCGEFQSESQIDSTGKVNHNPQYIPQFNISTSENSFLSSTGRSGRGEFLAYVLLSMLITVLPTAINLDYNNYLSSSLALGLVLSGFILLCIGTARRYRDIGYPISYVLLNFLPVINIIMLIVLLTKQTKKG